MEFLGSDLRLGGSSGISAFKPRVNSQASASAVTPDIASYDAYDFTALAADLTINNPTGTAYDFQRLVVRVVDDGTARNLAWGGNYRRLTDTPIPVATIPTKILECEFRYHAGLSVWVLMKFVVSNQLPTAITYINGGAYPFGGASSGTRTCDLTSLFSVGAPLQEGDILLVAAGSTGNGDGIAPVLNTAGFTQASTLTVIGAYQLYSKVWYKIMGASPDTSLEFNANTGGTSNALVVGVRGYRGVDQSTPLDVAVTEAVGENTMRSNPPSNTPLGGGGGSGYSVIFGFGVGRNVATFVSSDLEQFFTQHANSVNTEPTIGSGHKLVTATFDPAQFTLTGGPDETINAWSAAHLILRSS
jgi:hypothetical protein